MFSGRRESLMESLIEWRKLFFFSFFLPFFLFSFFLSEEEKTQIHLSYGMRPCGEERPLRNRGGGKGEERG